MTGEYKAVILDLDGTVVESHPLALPSEAVRQAVLEARQDGVAVSIATGRPFRLARHVIRALGVEDYCVVNGGCEITNPLTEQPVYTEPIVKESQEAALEVCTSLDIPLYDNANQYGGVPISNKSEISPSNPKLFVQAIPPDKADELIGRLKEIKELASYKSTSWVPNGVVDVHITDAHATKEEGVKTLIDMLDLTPGQVIGVGDSHNDLPFFGSVGLSVAMGDAPKEVQLAADVVSPPLEKDGVAWVLRNFVLNKAGAHIYPVDL